MGHELEIFFYNFMRKLTTTEFIMRARGVHGNRYDYSHAVYVSSHVKVCIICPEHGEFLQSPNGHLNGKGCRKCAGVSIGNRNKHTTDNFIEKAKKIHGDKYDYSLVDYQGSHKKVCIICPVHGQFWQSATNHLCGLGCEKCKNEKVRDLKSKGRVEFIHEAKVIHGNKYNYDEIVYKNYRSRLRIICPTHGAFYQMAGNHLKGCGCQKCATEYKKTQITKSTKEFIEEANNVHGYRYDYSKTVYIGANLKVCITCPIHGDFEQTPSSHIHGAGCPICSTIKASNQLRSSAEEFIEKANIVHSFKYDYSKVEYVNAITNVCVICPDHGAFYPTPNNHLRGSGCPICDSSRLELQIQNSFVNIVPQKTFPWLKYNRALRLDFYIESLNIAIECQGIQHFQPVDFAGKGVEWANQLYLELLERDKCKYELCAKHNIKIIYFFPTVFMQYEGASFYMDKICFHDLSELRNYLKKISTD